MGYCKASIIRDSNVIVTSKSTVEMTVVLQYFNL